MRRNRFWLAGLAACLALAIAGFADHKPGHKKPGGGGGRGGETILLVRADFTDQGELGSPAGTLPVVDRIQSDGFVGLAVAPVPCGIAHPFGDVWDYWDPNDTGATGATTTCGDGGQIKSNVSPGGRIHLLTGAQAFGPVEDARNRWLVFDFTEVVQGPDCATGGLGAEGLDQQLYGGIPQEHIPTINEDPCIDNLEVWIRPDRVFKNNATRQQLVIAIPGPAVLLGPEIGGEQEGDIFKLDFVNPLFIFRPVNGDPDVAILTTTGPNGEDVSEAELLDAENLVIGRYKMPFTIVLRRIVVSP